MRSAFKKWGCVCAAVLSVLSFAGCGNAQDSQPPQEPGVTANKPARLYEDADYPGVTYNETALLFLDEMFDDSLVSVYSNEADQSYTISAEANREAFGDKCDHYLGEDVISSIRDDWQTESWHYLEGATFSSSQPQIVFTDLESGSTLCFWLQAKFVGVRTASVPLRVFEISDDIVAAVSRQFETLPTAVSTRRTAEETVSAFFDALAAKDADAYNALLLVPVEFPYFSEGITDGGLITNNIGHIGAFPAEWCENPYANRIVVAQFRRTVAGGGSTDMRWEFYLVRETADAEWKIAAYGEA